MDFNHGSEFGNLVSKLTVASQHKSVGSIAKYIFVFVDEVVIEIMNAGLCCASVGSGEYFICCFVTQVFLNCLFDEVFAVENTDSHVLVCLEYDELWVVD